MICGKVWKFGDDIDTDAIIPGRYLDEYSPEILALHAMEGVDSEFASKVSKGDIIVAGRHFGIGSSREQAVIALMAAGVEVILAESFARIFYRNAINRGSLPLVCPGCSETFETGEKLCVDLMKGRASSLTDPKKSIAFQSMPAYLSKIHSSGGLIKMLRSEMSHQSFGDEKDNEFNMR